MLTTTDAQQASQKTRIAMKMAVDEVITCETCEDNDKCEYAFDPYNTGGDCLALK